MVLTEHDAHHGLAPPVLLEAPFILILISKHIAKSLDPACQQEVVLAIADPLHNGNGLIRFLFSILEL